MSSSDSSKSKISIFSESRSSLEVRGIAATPCCTSQRRQTCAARLAVAVADPLQRAVVLDAAPGDRAIGHQRHAVARAGLPHLGLVEIGMVFDLVAHQRLRTRRHRLLDQGHGEIGHADMAREPCLLDPRQRAERLRQRHLRIGPVQQQQVDLGQAQPCTRLSLGRPLEIMGREMRGPDLGGDEHLDRASRRGAQALADLAFVLVDLRGVDVAIAEPQRLARPAARRRVRAIPRCPARSPGFLRRWPRQTASVASATPLWAAGDSRANR